MQSLVSPTRFVYFILKIETLFRTLCITMFKHKKEKEKDYSK
jgi:hypothetical protein